MNGGLWEVSWMSCTCMIDSFELFFVSRVVERCWLSPRIELLAPPENAVHAMDERGEGQW